ncbi:MAG: serine/threonine-protein kinase [Kofleriaceae bacterium]
MTTGPDRRAGGSEAGWSEPPTRPARPGRPAVAAEHRYVDVELAGAGAMGTVMIAHDRRLDREVAVKRVAVDAGGPDAGPRLEREAAITARLEHPGIVPIYDAGTDADGRAYYAMRLIRGQSLADRLASTADADARLALVRPFLAVCQAMAYAHSRGVIHRDLKPANIMLGAFGEVHVVDWGLARTVDEPDDQSLAGTPAYLSPERARGEVAGPASDVWALGAILAELVDGAATPPLGRLEILARLASDAPPPRAWPAGSPPELTAIADKALAWAVADRYPDAGSLADDLSAYLDGRRVGAHAYSTSELARRLIHAWRWQVAATLAALVAGGTVLGLTWSRITGEQRRAVAAEHHASAALDDARSALAWALDRSAVASLLSGDIAEAEAAAAQALTYGESIEARGVLAATRAGGRPRTADRIDVAGCDEVVPDDARRFLCRTGHRLALWEVGQATPRWEVDTQASQFASLDGRWVFALTRGASVDVLDGATGARLATYPAPSLADTLTVDRRHARVAVHSQRAAIVIAPATGVVSGPFRPCEPTKFGGLVLDDARLIAACDDGHVIEQPLVGPARRLGQVPYGGANLPASAAASDPATGGVWIGGLDGSLALFVPDRPELVVHKRVLTEPVRTIRLVGALVAVAGERPGIHVWGRGLDTELVRLPERAGNRFEVVGEALLSGATSWWQWRLPAAPPARQYQVPSGLSGAAVDQDTVIAARGDGRVTWWRRGAWAGEVSLGAGVVKRIDLAPDGRTALAAVAATPGVTELDLESGRATPVPGLRASHRVGRLADGTVFVLPYLAAMYRRSVDGAWTTVATAELADAEPTPDRAALWLLGRAGEVFRGDDQPMAPRFVVHGATALAPLAGDHGVVVVTPGMIAVYRVDGRLALPLDAVPDQAFDVAVSPDERWIAAGTGAGTVEVWSTQTGHRVAHLRGHQARVAWIAFTAGALWSAGWDGEVRRWDVSAFDAPPDRLVADATAAWATPPPRRDR